MTPDFGRSESFGPVSDDTEPRRMHGFGKMVNGMRLGAVFDC